MLDPCEPRALPLYHPCSVHNLHFNVIAHVYYCNKDYRDIFCICILTLHQFANLLPNWTLIPILTLLPNFLGFHRTLQRVRLTNRGRLLFRTLGPVQFGTCICSNVETIDFFPEPVMSTDLLSFEHPSLLLFCSAYKQYLGINKNQSKYCKHSFGGQLEVNLTWKTSIPCIV